MTQQNRDKLGLVLWFIVAIVLGLISELFMIGREYYQHWKYKETNEFEWNDVFRYTVPIILGSLIHCICL